MTKTINNPNDFLTELNQNGVLFDWELFEKQLDNEKLIQNGIVDDINNLLEFPIDFNKPNDLAFTLYENNIFPREITFNYFKEHRYENPIYELLYKYKKVGQKITLLSSIKKYRSDDGRVRGQWQLNSSTTKRLGCSKPNLMSLPKVAKECVIPDKGKAIIQCDFSQIELRILAEITRDKNLLLAFDSGCDIHIATASLVYGKPTTEITEDERNSCIVVLHLVKNYDLEDYSVLMKMKYLRVLYVDYETLEKINIEELKKINPKLTIWVEQEKGKAIKL